MNTALLFVFLVTSSLIGGALLILIFGFMAKKLIRKIGFKLMNWTIGTLLRDKYEENLAELISALKRISFQTIIELSLRAERGDIIKRPIGSPKHYNDFDKLMFVPAQMAVMPVEYSEPIDLKVTLGPKAERPLIMDNPLIISGMGFGVSLSEKARIALAKGGKIANVVVNSGEGPFLQEERDAAGKYIWQIAHGPWSYILQAIDQADMVEVQVCQGARLGTHIYTPAQIKGKAQKLMGITPLDKVVVPARFPGISSPKDWVGFVQELRKHVKGKPIGVKLMATPILEKELEIIFEAGFDVINIDGAQGGSGASSPNLQDNYGLPALYGLMKAQRFLTGKGVRQQVSIIVSGGFYTPGDCLKALALGADAVALGTVPLFALTHAQIDKVLPWEPLTQLVYYNSKHKNKLDVDLAAKSVSNILIAMIKEMEEGMRAMGKKSLKELTAEDLVALNENIARITGVKFE